MTFPTLPTLATSATASNMTAARPAVPAAFSSGGGGMAFSAAFQAVQADVASFIADGGGASLSGPDTPLSADGAALRARLASQAIGGTQAADDVEGTEAVDGAGTGVAGDARQQFLATIRPHAEAAAARLGVSPDIVAAHAALESGWGQRPLTKGGADTNNLFGIKAGGNWQGDVAANVTTEYEHGAAVKKVEKFRSYPDQASAFRDYAELLASNPRYQKALNAGSDAHAFASGLQRGGYATDPAYAQKLSKLAARISRTEY